MIDYTVIHLSFISKLELLCYPDLSDKEQQEVERFINDAIVLDIDDQIKKKAISIWQESDFKLPDALIAGTAISKQLPFLSADSDFERVKELQLLLYEV